MMASPNWEQVKGILERAVYMAVAWAVAKGYIPVDQTQNVVLTVMSLFALIWAWKINTKPALDEASRSVKK